LPQGAVLAAYVPEQVVRQVVRLTDFVALASRYCKLTRKGNRYWALCPFHKEKTPSFTIDPETGLFYCFGCKEGGNIFSFLEKMEGLQFPEALEKLAAAAGVDLGQYRARGGPSRDDVQKMREANELAAAFYRKCLEKGKGGEEALRYIAGRGINSESAERWRLGLAPDGWEHLLNLARSRGYEAALLEKAGLILSRKDVPGYHDRFRNRLMFPIEDRGGGIIGFGARALREGDEPKYLNSPETPLFSKGRCFYGLSKAKEAIRAEKTAVVVEGYTDVIMCHQFGVQNALGVLGTALTEEHGRQLSRLCEKVILVFDGDEAGRKSAMRSIEVLAGEELDVYVARLQAGQDPCEVLLERGADAFRKVLDESQDFLRFRLSVAEADHDLGTVGGRSAAFREVAELALHMKDEAKRDIVVRRVAQELGISGASAWHYIERKWQDRRPSARGQDAESVQPVRSADRAWASEMLGFLLVHGEFLGQAAERVDIALLAGSPESRVLERLLRQFGRGEGSNQRELLNSLGSQDVSIAQEAMVREESVRLRQTTARERFEGLMAYLDGRREREELRSLSPTVNSTIAPKTATKAAGDGAEPDEPSDEQLKAFQQKLEQRDRRKREELR